MTTNSTKRLIGFHLYILRSRRSKFIKENIKFKTKVKFRFFPLNNKQEFDFTKGDFHKYEVTLNNWA